MNSLSTASAFDAGITREEVHFRRIDMRAYRRADGLYEIEGQVTDRRPHDFMPLNGARPVRAHEPIHDMGVRLLYDKQLLIHDVQTFTLASPYSICPEGGRALQSVKGLRMASGWNKEVRSRLGGARSCTHLMEILIPMATAAFQSLTVLRLSQPDRLDPTGQPAQIDSCYAYAAEREIVRRRWPGFYRASTPPEDKAE